MIATHVLDERTETGSLALGQAVAGGRASALFAVLAGVSLALMARRRPVVPGLVVRALLIAAVGLALGELDSGLAIILTYYGLLFLLAIPFLGLSAPALLVLAAAWVVVAPVVSHVVRPDLPGRGFESPSLSQLGDPSALLSELAFTGYYPVVPWLAYALVGLALGRLDLSGRRVPAVLLGVGASLAVVATAVSRWLTSLPSVAEALVADPPAGRQTIEELLDAISTGMAGTTPTGGTWQWLLVVAPHSATPFDLVQTIGSAVAVIGASLLLVASVGELGERFLAVLFGAGTMTLTLYSLHVVLRTEGVLPTELADSYLFHVVVVLGIGMVVAGLGRQGPLERVVGLAVRAANGRRLGA
ncbi:DUF1624 domain-containing protein [Nocardioides seonyuensis]|uniref:DUF1624 domain-containing protein n=2 Tax=Nocardioides seonyuensis TaxID=2518371 RepID=A0A4P7IHU9_9ACTN|nr:DUF1624 domain-containing protein [Nocardioides seonyuensis]